MFHALFPASIPSIRYTILILEPYQRSVNKLLETAWKGVTLMGTLPKCPSCFLSHPKLYLNEDWYLTCF